MGVSSGLVLLLDIWGITISRAPGDSATRGGWSLYRLWWCNLLSHCIMFTGSNGHLWQDIWWCLELVQHWRWLCLHNLWLWTLVKPIVQDAGTVVPIAWHHWRVECCTLGVTPRCALLLIPWTCNQGVVVVAAVVLDNDLETWWPKLKRLFLGTGLNEWGE